jgi:hypothetical protein
MTNFQVAVRSLLQDLTGYDIEQRWDAEYECQGFALIDLYGDQDGDLFHDFTDLVYYISSAADMDQAIAAIQV